MKGVDFSFQGRPPRKNERSVVIRIGKRGSLRNSDRFVAFVEEVRRVWDHVNCETISEGRWSLSVHGVWDRLRHLDHDFPIADSDAPLSFVKDALQAAGVIDDDVRIDEDHTSRGYDRDLPRLEIKLRRLDA